MTTLADRLVEVCRKRKNFGWSFASVHVSIVLMQHTAPATISDVMLLVLN